MSDYTEDDVRGVASNVVHALLDNLSRDDIIEAGYLDSFDLGDGSPYAESFIRDVKNYLWGGVPY